LAVFGARYFFTTEMGTDFLNRYSGHMPLPDNAPVGIPAWMNWQHFFNMFFIVLIIRSGLQIRYERKPAAYFTPKKSSAKISLTLWFHLVLDLLWVINGAIFIVLLFATGHWMRIVPTSWEVFPHALSAGLQYLTLDWPTENGWANYNALQLLTYFLTVFVAAPLAIVSGFRMSHFWSKKWTKASKFYPAPVARKIHYPVMIYLVIFIIVHVVLVLATGALRNLNHMYAAQGDVDPTVYANNWTGFFIFLGSLVVLAAAWIAARPMLLAPVARLFGKVTAR
jgi:thiosulfate reductase cytochrome b subunit